MTNPDQDRQQTAPATERSRWMAPVARSMIVVALCWFVLTQRTTIRSSSGGLLDTDFRLVVAGVAFSAAAMVNRGLLNHAAHHATGLDPSRAGMIKTTAVAFAANKVIKSGGASGLAVFLRRGRVCGFANASVTASCIIASATSLAALGLLLATAALLLGVNGTLVGWWLVAAAGFSTYTIILVIVARCVSTNEQTLTRWWIATQRLRNRLARRPGVVEPRGVGDLLTALAMARSLHCWTSRAGLHAVVSKTLGIAMFFSAAAAAGVSISTTDAVVIYSAALAASFVSIVPAGVGVVEASTGAMLIAAGATAPAAALSVALFRIFDLWLPVGFGLILGRHEAWRAAPVDYEACPPVAALPALDFVLASTEQAPVSCLSAELV